MRIFLYDDNGNLISAEEVGKSIYFIGDNGESGIVGEIGFSDIIEHTYQTLQHLYQSFIETIDEYNSTTTNKSFKMYKPSFENFVFTSIDLGKLMLTEDLSKNNYETNISELINIINLMNDQVKDKSIKIIGVDIEELKKQMEEKDDKKSN